MFKTLLPISLFLLLASCATLFSDGEDVITFKSEPSGAQVFLNAQLIGKTPLSYKMDRDTFQKPVVTVKKKGYEPQTFELEKQIESIVLLNLTSVFSWTTDAASGNMFRYSPNGYYSELKRKGAAFKSNKEAHFVIVNSKSLQNDLSRGEGEYLTALSLLRKESIEEIMSKVRPYKGEIFNQKDSVDFYRTLNLHLN